MKVYCVHSADKVSLLEEGMFFEAVLPGTVNCLRPKTSIKKYKKDSGQKIIAGTYGIEDDLIGITCDFTLGRIYFDVKNDYARYMSGDLFLLIKNLHGSNVLAACKESVSFAATICKNLVDRDLPQLIDYSGLTSPYIISFMQWLELEQTQENPTVDPDAPVSVSPTISLNEMLSSLQKAQPKPKVYKWILSKNGVSFQKENNLAV